MSKTETMEIKHRYTGAVLFSARVDVSLSDGLKIGAAVKLAIKADANLAGANLADANLAGANLARAYLTGAYLTGANLAGANLAGANLAGANLARAYLADANLAGANLARAYLTDANLAGANLADANLAGANIARANGLLDCGSPYSWRVVIVAHTDGIRISARCRWMTFEEATARWKKRGEERALMLPLLAYVKAAAKIKGWKL